jgi:hypothetical protein
MSVPILARRMFTTLTDREFCSRRSKQRHIYQTPSAQCQPRSFSVSTTDVIEMDAVELRIPTRKAEELTKQLVSEGHVWQCIYILALAAP